MSNSTKSIESEPARILTCAYCGASDESALAAAYHVCDKAALENRISNQAARIAELEAHIIDLTYKNGILRTELSNAAQLIPYAGPVSHRIQVLMTEYGEGIRTLQAERDQYRRDYDAELNGNRELRERFGAQDRESFTAFIERVVRESRRHEEWARTMEIERDWERNVAVPDLEQRLREIEAELATLRAQAERDAAMLEAVKDVIASRVEVNGRAQVNSRAFDALIVAVRTRRDAGEGEAGK